MHLTGDSQRTMPTLPVPIAVLALFIRGIYVGTAIAVQVGLAVPFLREWMLSYGKTLQPAPPTPKPTTTTTAKTATQPDTSNAIKPEPTLWAKIQDLCMVRKYLFWHFYALGVPWGCYLLWTCFSPPAAPETTALWRGWSDLNFIAAEFGGNLSASVQVRELQPLLETMALHFLIVVQMLRRLYECLYVSTPSAAKMHVAHYFVGMGYYLVTPVAVGVEGWWWWWSTHDEERFTAEAVGRVRPRHVAAVFMFAYASYQQNRAHVHLSLLRNQSTQIKPKTSPESSKGIKTPDSPGVAHHAKTLASASCPPSALPSSAPVYKLPTDGWFQYVACPHYLFEMTIYLSLCVLTGFTNWTLTSILFWVVIDLAAVADSQFDWYTRTFPDRIPHNWRRVLPWVY
ncbi:hypothetical protein DFJ77DRAFT_126649 [Powellomyces hirtus]|nr:hypothetical protein DFJ77DRAFT_126649 [Powellomyces hirtus]